MVEVVEDDVDVVLDVVVVEVVDGIVVVVETVVDVVVDDVVVLVEVDVVVEQGQFGKSGGGFPTATFRHMSASVAVTGGIALRSQIHSGVHMVVPTAAFRMKRQSVETGVGPSVTGWPQSPMSARTSGAPAVKKMIANAAANRTELLTHTCSAFIPPLPEPRPWVNLSGSGPGFRNPRRDVSGRRRGAHRYG